METNFAPIPIQQLPAINIALMALAKLPLVLVVQQVVLNATTI
jgi:hypothetical protein